MTTIQQELIEEFGRIEWGMIFRLLNDDSVGFIKHRFSSLIDRVRAEREREHRGELFTHAEFSQLISYCEWATRDGSFYGNREQYWKRHKRIMEKLNKLLPKENE